MQLQCRSCPATISSSWFFRHPGTSQIHVLVPQNGHDACKKRLGKPSPWIPTSGWSSKLDIFSLLNFCHHKREITACVLCGGRRICEHKKRRDECALCKQLPRHLKASARKKGRQSSLFLRSLVGGLEHFFHILEIIIPTDELIFFRGLAQPPTRIGLSENRVPQHLMLSFHIF